MAHPLIRKIIRKVITRDGVVVVSFPKCGRSWLGLVLGHAVMNEYGALPDANPADFYALSRLDADIPIIDWSHDDQPQTKTVPELETDKRGYSRNHVIFLVRDPRDVIISWYFQYRYRDREQGLPEQIDASSPGAFVHNRRGGLETVIEFFNIWMRNRDVPQAFMLLRYEDLRQDTSTWVRRVFAFAGCPDLVSDASLGRAIEHCRFEKVREREARGEIKNIAFQRADASNPESFKARRAKVGGYVDYLQSEEVAAMDAMIRERLDPALRY